MIAIRVFLYISIPLLILSALKGGIISADYLQMVIYIIPFSILIAVIIGMIKKDLNSISSRFLDAVLIGIVILWGMVFGLYKFWKTGLCAGFDSCDFLTIPKILITLLVSATPIVALKISRKASSKNE